MLIKNIEIKSFRKLNDFYLDLSKTEQLDDKKNMNMTILIGENGTAKTTLFEVIINMFLFKDNFPTEKCEIEYFYENEMYTTRKESVPTPDRIIVSTYTPIDKLDQIEPPDDKQILYKTNINRINLQYVLTRILKHFSINPENMNAIFEYVGYGEHKLFLEISGFKLKGVSDMCSRAFRKLVPQYEKISYLFEEKYKNNDFESILLEYQEELYNFRSKIQSEVGERITYNINIRKGLSNYLIQPGRDKSEKNIYEICALEILFIIYKMRIFLKLSKESFTQFDHKEKLLLPIEKISQYHGGVDSFQRDIMLLEACSTSFWKDLWFEDIHDKVPLSMLSSGELSMFIRIFDLYDYVIDNSLVLIDEPETHLHPKWIKGYVALLNKLFGEKKCHVLIATHSPLIVSDVPKNCIVVLKNHQGNIQQVNVKEKTLGLNYDDILSDVFGLDDYKGKMIHEYAKVFEKELENENLSKALEIYSQMADSNVKYELYPKLKAYLEQKGERNV